MKNQSSISTSPPPPHCTARTMTLRLAYNWERVMTLFLPTLAAASSAASSTSSSLFANKPRTTTLAEDDPTSTTRITTPLTPLASAMDAIATKAMTQVFAFAGGAMAPTLGREDAADAARASTSKPSSSKPSYVLARRLAYPFRSAQVGDVVAFTHPQDEARVLIRRVSAIEGDELVDAANASVYVVPNAHCWVTSDADADEPEARFEDSRTFGPIALNSIEWRVMYSFESAVNHGAVVNSAEASVADEPVLREDLTAARESLGY